MKKRSDTAPIFIQPVRVHDFRPELLLHSMCQHAVAPACFRIELCGVGEWKNVDRIEKVSPGISISRWLREPNVKTTARACCALDHQSIKHSSMRLVLIEAIV